MYYRLSCCVEDFPVPIKTKGAEYSKLERCFFNLSTEKSIEVFHEKSVDDQYRLLIFGSQFRHPPSLYLTREFAKNGPSVLPFLKIKLMEVKDDETIRDIVVTIIFMNDLGLYDVKSDADLMTLLSKKADSMSGWKDFVQDQINELKK